MTNFTCIVVTAVLIACFVGILVIFDRAVGEVMDEYKRQCRAEQRERKMVENAVDEISTRVQLNREQLFRDYVREVGQ